MQQSGHHSFSQTLREIRQSPDVAASLWRGTIPSTLRTGFGSALYFTSLNCIRQQALRAGAGTSAARRHSSSLPTLSNTANMASGMLARSFAGFLLMPLTIIKVRYESTLYNYRTVLDAGRDILQKEGLRGLFSGVGATTIRDAPNAGLYVLFYEQFKSQLSLLGRHSSSGGRKEAFSPACINFVSGILAGTSCATVSNPFDAVKTRIQLQPNMYYNMWHGAAKMMREEGPRAFSDGLALRISRKALSSALAWTLYEELIKAANKALEQKPGEYSSKSIT